MIYSARPKSRSLSDNPLSLRIHEPPQSEGSSRSTDTSRTAGNSRTHARARTEDRARLEGHSQLERVAAPLSEIGVDQFDLELAADIIARIESRLPGRIRQLTVCTTENAVVLTGECCTFYTKQVAQHAAMGVLEYEQLINNIDVQVIT